MIHRLLLFLVLWTTLIPCVWGESPVKPGRSRRDLPLDLAFDKTPLPDVLRDLASRYRVNLVLDPVLLRNYGPEELMVTLRLRRVRLGRALDVLALIMPQLGYRHARGYILVTTRNRAAGKAVVRTYEVGDLLPRTLQFVGPRPGVYRRPRPPRTAPAEISFCNG